MLKQGSIVIYRSGIPRRAATGGLAPGGREPFIVVHVAKYYNLDNIDTCYNNSN